MFGDLIAMLMIYLLFLNLNQSERMARNLIFS